MKNDFVLECCVDSVVSALHAKEGGASRLELCANLPIGGTTPDMLFFQQVQEATGLPIHVLIRPRFGDFHYNAYEVDLMERQVDAFRKANATAVVIGALTRDGELDVETLKRLIKAAGPMKITLHRAFDMCKDPKKAFAQAKDLGIHTILTSGQKASCLEGKELVAELVELSQGTVEILAGAGVNSGNIKAIYQATKTRSFHMSGKEIVPSAMEYRNKEVSMGLPSLSEYEQWITSKEEVKKAVDVINQLQ